MTATLIRPFEFDFLQGSTFTLSARAAGEVDGEASTLTQGDVTSMTLTAFDLSSATPTTSIFTTPQPTALNNIEDTLLGWELDSVGYNLHISIAAASLSPVAQKGHVYLFKLVIVSATKGTGVYQWTGTCQ